MFRTTLCFLLLLILPINKSAALTFRAGETLRFKIHVFGIHVGYQDMTLHGIRILNGKKVLYATADTKSLESIKKTFNYSLHDVIHVWMDPKTFYPVKIKKSIQEGNWRDKILINLNHKTKQAIYYDKRNKKGIKMQLLPKTLDLLSLIYFIRGQKAYAGQRIHCNYLDDKKGIKKITLNISQGETLRIRKKRIKTLYYHQIGGHGVKVRMTDDKHRIPLKITVATFKVHGYSINIVGHLVNITQK